MTKTKYENVFVEGQDIYRIINGSYHKLSKWIDNVGYYQVVFRINKRRKYVRVHRLIAQTLLPNPNGYTQINHIDGNKLNNSLNNLQWCTNAHNTQEGYNNNLYKSKSSCKIVAIKKDSGQILQFNSIRSCAQRLKLNRKTITMILKNQKRTNNYPYDFQYLEGVSTIPDECKGLGSEISTEPKRKAAS